MREPLERQEGREKIVEPAPSVAAQRSHVLCLAERAGYPDIRLAPAPVGRRRLTLHEREGWRSGSGEARWTRGIGHLHSLGELRRVAAVLRFLAD
jgi:hypothetical protein